MYIHCCYGATAPACILSTIYVELKNPIESAVALNNERVVIRGVDCRTLCALGMPLPRLR